MLSFWGVAAMWHVLTALVKTRASIHLFVSSKKESVEPSGQLTLSRLPMRSVLCARMHLRGTLDFVFLSLLPEAILQSVWALSPESL